ncbi:DUF481 domain-containing protein [Candidatus Kapabacteria bacterium]|nr:DUF481 domain-containing protein [Candidatus Kapabacteria bacterium]
MNTENLRKELDSNGVYASTQVNYGLRSGNVKFQEGGLSLRLDFLSDLNKSFIISSFNYKDNNKKIIDRNGFVHLRSSFFRKNLFKPELLFQLEFDEFRKLSERFLAGANIRYDLNLHDSSSIFTNLKLSFGTGIFYENEILAEDIIYKSYIWRHNNFLTLDYVINNSVSLRTVTYAQYDFFNIEDIRLLNESALLFNINKVLQFTFSINYRFDNQPADQVESTDLYIKNGLRINL